MKTKITGHIPELTRVSSKGQVVIPTNVRKRLKIGKGSVFAVTAKRDLIVMKKLDTKIKATDLETLKLIEEAWEDIEKRRYKSATPEKFFEELAKWKR